MRHSAVGRVELIGLAVVCALLGSPAAFADDGIAPVAPNANGSLVILPSYNSEPPPDLLDGTLSGIGDEEENDEPKSGYLRFPSPLQPWLDFKQALLQTYGFSIGGSEGILGQDYSNSLTDNHNAVGQKFTLNVGQQILFAARRTS